ncbi:unnamed protein product [Didymodactylos carnosus]|uniref:TauD/TfdA-like domain-containing protein n=1 Tax=Didymodactylos carnosus TaxID=1234261 RepID=A0A814GLV1_9BILA|nr:unnamed protein product [Didymodactylos carnosus]CAF3769556.1 unnamed protein product [Didymodactylos carnosus]
MKTALFLRQASTLIKISSRILSSTSINDKIQLVEIRPHELVFRMPHIHRLHPPFSTTDKSLSDLIRLPVAWLRLNCQSLTSFQPSSGQRLQSPADLPFQLSIAQAYIDEKEVLKIRWNTEQINNISSTLTNDELTQYPELLNPVYSGKNISEPLKQISDVQQTDESSIPLEYILNYNPFNRSSNENLDLKISDNTSLKPQVINYNEKFSDHRDLILDSLFEQGIVIIKNVPCKPYYVKTIAELISFVQQTIYGDIFVVKTTNDPINIAYSNEKLYLHQDLCYYESPPGLQLLHCLRNDPSIMGGEQIYLDVMLACEDFRTYYPVDFQLLCDIPITFQKVHYKRERPVHLHYSRPIIKINLQEKIVAVYWSPMFEAPIQGINDVNQLRRFYQAYVRLSRFLETHPSRYKHTLESGDCIIFNNRRMVHGREKFQLKRNENVGERYLEGCYVNIDEFKNECMMSRMRRGINTPAMRVGNGDLL